MPKPSLVGPLPSASERHGQFLSRFDTYFSTQEATSAELINCALALRFQVYCIEREFENAAHFADRLETDALDRHSLHGLLFHRLRGDAIGTVRLILPQRNTISLPVQRLLREMDIDLRDYFPLNQTAEVSRFAISRELRRWHSDESLSVEDRRAAFAAECRSNLPCLGLVQILVRMSLARGISYWSALMEPKLLRMLGTIGIQFTSIGPLISHHGIRQPSYCHVPTMLELLRSKKPAHWDIVTDGGTLLYPTAAQDRASIKPFHAARGRDVNYELIQNTFPRADDARGFSRSLQLSFLALMLISAGLGMAMLG
jgi:N-acyl amino acid synthase of PEP-CTERM/exosortase system